MSREVKEVNYARENSFACVYMCRQRLCNFKYILSKFSST